MSAAVLLAQPWREVELEFAAEAEYAAPYLDVDLWVDFRSGTDVFSRPAFWDGGRMWRVRFAPPYAGEWGWVSRANVADAGLVERTGRVDCRADPHLAGHAFYDHGFWRMSPGHRNLVHADGTPALLVADTAWALPFRATPEQARVYAQDRQAKGFNAALLMTVQPDMRAIGPRDRTQDEGFDVGFEDLPAGHLTELNAAYFRCLDGLLGILVEHEIVPILSPVFQGFGWKGLDVAGLVVPPEEYARYCRYLVARYGARPVIYLVGADGLGVEPQVEAGGIEVSAVDAYGQPTGIHYAPHAGNSAHQDAEWLDFQWCQTGHVGEHVPERVADMWRNLPEKGVANGEPTYENTREVGLGAGWWQGDEAWRNICAGGTMGVFYGAASLWQWRLHPNEPGHLDYFLGPNAGWREALTYEGATYVGLVGKILRSLSFADMAPDWSHGARGVSVPGQWLLIYRETGGLFMRGDPGLPPYGAVIDPRTGDVLRRFELGPDDGILQDAAVEPRLYVFTREPATWA
jgi:Protein of unknown function (DUF4038)/Domain of unknown function (DUF5060)